MKTQLKNKSWWNGAWGNLLVPIGVALIFLAFTFAYYPFREKLQFDTDEGLNLMRSMLVDLGHPLYAEVSSDQPPLFTQLLALLFRLIGFEVTPARLLVLLFSTLLVWAGAQFLQLTWGKLAALLLLPLVIIAPRYLVLSVSVMIGVPAIAMAAVALVFITLWHQQKRSLWLVLSGFALALSVLIKLFTGFLAPIFVIGVTLAAYLDQRPNGFSWKIFRPALLWGLCFAGLAALLGIVLVGPRNIPQIVSPHLNAPTEASFQGEIYTLNYQLQAAIPLLLLGLLGVPVVLYRRNWLSLYPLAWAALAYVLFSFYSPVLYHHQLLITIPLALVAAAGLGEGLLALSRVRRIPDLLRLPSLLGAATLLAFVLVFINYWPVVDQELMDSPRLSGFSLTATSGKLKIIRAMNQYIERTNWIVTDMPMYAFLVNRPVPPILATFSRKRLVTGSLTDEDILTAMREYNPEQVLMARFTIPALEAYLQEHYTLVASPEYFRLFIRNDLNPTIIK
jgi:4-amino-4-deoxy-L-arabinose transferase-like glycosyltransferase